MVSHSLIVGALLGISLSVSAGAITMDGISVVANSADAMVNSNAALHKDVGLRQGGGNGKDVAEAPVRSFSCVGRHNCSVAQAETVRDLLTINAQSSGAGPLVLIVLILISSFAYLRRARFTK